MYEQFFDNKPTLRGSLEETDGTIGFSFPSFSLPHLPNPIQAAQQAAARARAVAQAAAAAAAKRAQDAAHAAAIGAQMAAARARQLQASRTAIKRRIAMTHPLAVSAYALRMGAPTAAAAAKRLFQVHPLAVGAQVLQSGGKKLMPSFPGMGPTQQNAPVSAEMTPQLSPDYATSGSSTVVPVDNSIIMSTPAETPLTYDASAQTGYETPASTGYDMSMQPGADMSQPLGYDNTQPLDFTSSQQSAYDMQPAGYDYGSTYGQPQSYDTQQQWNVNQSYTPGGVDYMNTPQSSSYADQSYAMESPASSGNADLFSYDVGSPVMTSSDGGTLDYSTDYTMQGLGSFLTDIVGAYQQTQQKPGGTGATPSTTTTAQPSGGSSLPSWATGLIGIWQQKKLVDINAQRMAQGLPPVSDTTGLGAQVNVAIDPGLKKAMYVGGAAALGLLGYMMLRPRRR